MTDYSDKPLRDKLGLKPGMSCYFVHAPSDYVAQIGNYPRLADEESGYDFIHVFYSSKAELESFAPFLVSKVADKGMLWVSWPKKASGMQTDISEQDLRDIFLPEGLVDVKVCAVTEVWSGLKFVWRRS